MKNLLRNFFINSLSLFFVSQMIDGVKVTGGLEMYAIGGIVLTLLFMIIRPILKLITLPLHFLTFGTFIFVINALIFYFLTIIIPQISVSEFTFKGLSFYGFVIPKIYFNLVFSYLLSAFLFSLTSSSVRWITTKK